MPDRNSDPDSGSGSTAKRSLPPWMSSVESNNKSQKKLNDSSSKGSRNTDKEDSGASSCVATQDGSNFSKLLEGVVFVLSGIVNPERGTLRAQALEMGAEYQPDWTSSCTLLICAFPNTPKFRQVEAECGTIVSKEWISECYNHKKLVGIERYLMYAGKPWRRCIERTQPSKVKGSALSEEPLKRAGKPSMIITGSGSSEGGTSGSTNNPLLPSQIKEWAAVDMIKTISWLESQDEKPQAMEIRSIASEGILTCLQDVLDSLKQNKAINTVTDKWMFVPRVVAYLAEMEGKSRVSRKELYEIAVSCQNIYKSELKQLNGSTEIKKPKIEDCEERNDEPDEEGFDSDRTIEMTEEEIEFACKQFG